MIIITGHGNFGSGLKSSLDFIVGNYDFVKVVDFTGEKSPQHLKQEILSCINNEEDKTFIFTDLVGGTPFNVSSELILNNSNIEVLSGTNLPMLIEATMMISLGLEIDSELIKEAGVNGIKPPVKQVVFTDDGI